MHKFQEQPFFFWSCKNDRLYGNTFDGQIGWHDFGKYPWLTFKKGPFRNEIASFLVPFVTHILFWRRFFFLLFLIIFFKLKSLKEWMNYVNNLVRCKKERKCRNYYCLSAFFPWNYIVNALEASPILHFLWLLSCIFMMFL